MVFKNRKEAAKLLAQKLLYLKGKELIVLAIPRGGLPLGVVISKELNVPLDIVLIKKIGHPSNKEYAIGAVTLKNRVLGFGAEMVSNYYIESETLKIRDLLKKRQRKFYKKTKPQNLQGKTVIIVDDGIATGNTILATIELVYNEYPAKIIVAVPVAPVLAIKKLENSPYLDKLICLEPVKTFYAVGNHYDIFNQITDDEAIYLFEEANKIIR
jgi:predicted phosphoribosyltransferase